MARATIRLSVLALAIVSAGIVPRVPGVPGLLAHHGTGASYYQDRTVKITGKVTEFAWKNPHSQLYIDVTEGEFKGKNYAVELNSPGVMVRQGWTKKQFQPGDDIVINVHPSKTGAAVGECLSCTVSVNGKETSPK